MYKTYEKSLQAVKQFPPDLQWVPKKFRTYELYMESIKKSEFGWCIIYVPKELQSLEMCIIALQDEPYNIRCIKNRSQDLIDYCKLMNILI